MSGESFEWAIKKDVRNNPIVREIDRERHREMWKSAGVGVFLVASVSIRFGERSVSISRRYCRLSSSS